jgi:hypothetical protein
MYLITRCSESLFVPSILSDILVAAFLLRDIYEILCMFAMLREEGIRSAGNVMASDPPLL